MVKNNAKDKNKNVLVCVLKSKRDLNLLIAEKWYRIPMAHMPARKFKYLAFYQPVSFGRRGKRILYYAKILNYQIAKRRKLLPKETGHSRAENFYLKIRIGKIKKLLYPVKNITPRRISFGFTTIKRLLKSKNILELYNVEPIENIMEEELRQEGIKAAPQYSVKCGNKRFRLDFAIFCQNGFIAVECDNKKAHFGLGQRKKDRIKDSSLRRSGWVVIRLSEHDVVSNLESCMARVKKAIRKLGGICP